MAKANGLAVQALWLEQLQPLEPSKEIAVVMNVSVRTVEGHRRMVLSRMHVSSAAQLVRTVLGARKGASVKRAPVRT